MEDTDIRFLQCPYCDGQGGWEESGWGEDDIRMKCENCQGTGTAETRVYPVTLDDMSKYCGD